MPTPLQCICLLFTACLCLSSHYLLAQNRRAKVVVDRQMKDTFSFTTQWDYYWMVMKDDSTGKFTRTSNEPLTPKDTAHLFYTANCTTNVQGGYTIRYCYAQKTGNTLKLIFSDGLPAYGSEFYCYVSRDSFYFKPAVNYPLSIAGQRIYYTVTNQQLTLNKPAYAVDDSLTGYIDVEFTETASAPAHATQKRRLYLKGCIKTPVKSVASGQR